MIINIKDSRSLGTVFGALHLGAVLIIFLVDISHWLRVLLALATLLSFYQVFMQHVLRRSKRAIQGLRLNSSGEMLLRVKGSRSWQTVTLESRFVHPALVLLRVHLARRRFAGAVVIPADAVNPQAFRRLRAALLALPRTPEA